MVTLPAATPVTTPELLTVAMELLPLVQAPPLVVSDRVIMVLTQTEVGPVMVPAPAGVVPTVIVFMAVVVPQLLVLVKVILAVPEVTPKTMPVVLPTVAIAVLLLLHVPPVAVSVRVMVVPVHTKEAPDIGLTKGKGLTVTS